MYVINHALSVEGEFRDACVHEGRRLRRHPDASKQVLRQYRRARPSSHQTNHPSDTLIQVVLECTKPHRRNRNYAHDSQGPDRLARRFSRVRSGPVLQPCCLKTRPTKRLFSAMPH